MKNLILFLFLSFYSSVVLYSQSASLITSDMEWTYGMIVGDGYSESAVLYNQEIVGTEEVNGLTYYQITNSGIENISDAGLIREEDQRIYFIPQDSTTEVLLYDFNLEIGDAFIVDPWLKSLPGYSGLLDDTIYVEEVETIESETGEELKKMELRGESVAASLTWIEKLGTDYGSLTSPRGFGAPEYNIRPSLICLRTPQEQLYEKVITATGHQEAWTKKYGCGGLITSTEEQVEEQEGILVSPNPFTSTIALESTQTIESISIYAITGQLITTLDQPGPNINLSYLSKGMYWAVIKTKEGRSRHAIVKL